MSEKVECFKKCLFFFIASSILYFPLFSHLGAFPIRIWDEARLAINAYEMLNNGNIVVTHFDGEPDMWNTKPPLMIWLQVLCMKIFGVGEFTVRLPSAIAALGTCLAMLFLSKRYLNNHWLGIIAVLVLITSQGYISIHGTRTGDYDALLTLFTTTACFAFFAFTEKRQNKWLYLFFVLLTLAVLTKSITALLFAPALVLYLLWRKQFLQTLKNKHLYIGTIGFLIISLGYYLLREAYNPGYLNAVYENDLGGRFLSTIESHNHDNWYYYNNLLHSRFSNWFLLLPCSIVAGFLVKDEKLKRLTVFSTLLALVFLLVISTSRTKLIWYDIPLYPFMAILVAVFITTLFNLLNAPFLQQYFKVNPLPYILLFLLFISPYQAILQKTYIPQEEPWDKDFYEISYYLRDGLRGVHNLNNKTLCYDGYHAQLDFYLNLMNEKGTNVHLKDWTKVQPGEVVFTYQDTIKSYLNQNFYLDTLDQYYRITTFHLLERKLNND